MDQNHFKVLSKNFVTELFTFDHFIDTVDFNEMINNGFPCDGVNYAAVMLICVMLNRRRHTTILKISH